VVCFFSAGLRVSVAYCFGAFFFQLGVFWVEGLVEWELEEFFQIVE
jgi:hypothetical protein